jgi:hypothetical protein
MKKLEDIPKRNIFEVPEGYFDRLPLQIQSRIEKEAPNKITLPSFSLSWQYAIPVLAIGFAAYILWPTSKPEQDSLLASVSTEHLVAYLNETDISTEDLLEETSLNETDADSLNAVINSNYKIEGVDLNEMQDVLDNEL